MKFKKGQRVWDPEWQCVHTLAEDYDGTGSIVVRNEGYIKERFGSRSKTISFPWTIARTFEPASDKV